MQSFLIALCIVVGVGLVLYAGLMHKHHNDEKKAIHYQKISNTIFKAIIVVALISLFYFSKELLPLFELAKSNGSQATNVYTWNNYPSTDRIFLWTDLLRVLIRAVFYGVITWGIVKIVATEE
ncbi:MAG: hypothetical protein D6732_02955 [Methanobacteriota archaeon]|nr:MAG: hypothetical protein D6732_02955 [Euryarchaeota archaeon]